jgi:hypothetical protein
MIVLIVAERPAVLGTSDVCEGVGGRAMLGGGTGGFTLMRVGIFTKKCFEARETRVLARVPLFFDGEGLVRRWSLKARWEKESLRLALRPAAVRVVRVERGESGGVRRL